MGLLRGTYRGFSASTINGRLSNTCDHSVSGSNVDCTNITTTKVETVLGLSLGSHSVSTLCTHANIKKWSAWSPYLITINNAGMNGTIVWNLPSNNYSLGSFAGYNHNANIPAYYSTTHSNTVITTSDSESVTVEVQFDIGELILTNLNSALGITLAVFNGASYVTNATRALSTLEEQCRASNSRAFTVYVNGPSGISTWNNKQSITYTFTLYLISGTSYSYNSNEIAKLFHNELPSFTKKIIKQFPTDIDWSIQSGMQYASTQWNNPYVSFIVASTSQQNTYHVCINAVMYNENDQQVGSSQNLYHGDVDYQGVTISNFNLSTVWGTIPSYNRYIRITTATHTYSSSPPCGCS